MPYKDLVVPTNLKEDRWITAAEIRSTGRSAVHHVIVFIQDPKNPAGVERNLLAGVARGEQPARYRPGFGKKIPAGAKLRFEFTLPWSEIVVAGSGVVTWTEEGYAGVRMAVPKTVQRSLEDWVNDRAFRDKQFSISNSLLSTLHPR